MNLLYEIKLGIDRAARDTRKRVLLIVRGTDPISAAVRAEKIVDSALENPVEYSHAMSCTQIMRPVAAAAMPVEMAMAA